MTSRSTLTSLDFNFVLFKKKIKNNCLPYLSGSLPKVLTVCAKGLVNRERRAAPSRLNLTADVPKL